MNKSLLFGTIAVIIGLALALFVYLGAFKPVQVQEGDYGPLKLVYKAHTGAYHKIVPTIEEVERWAKANGESCRLSFGEYLDNPDVVEEGRLRSNGGCVVEKDWSNGLPEGFQSREVPVHRYVIAEFEGAPSIGPIKVYPKAQDYIAAKNLKLSGPVIELYEILSPKAVHTRYLFPIE